MATVSVRNLDGETVSTIDLDDAIFAAPVKEHLLWEAVVAERASKRSGTANTKGRSEIRGSTRKLYKQKGTGNARHGSKKAPIYVGGGQVFGPKPRSFEAKLPKKMRRGALISALSLRAQEEKLIVLKDFELDEIKTKRVAGVLDKLGVETGLIIEDRGNENLIRSVRNLEKAKYLAPEGLNVFDILKHSSLIVTEPVVRKLQERFSASAKSDAVEAAGGAS